jgi:hypothetical protein
MEECWNAAVASASNHFGEHEGVDYGCEELLSSAQFDAAGET